MVILWSGLELHTRLGYCAFFSLLENFSYSFTYFQRSESYTTALALIEQEFSNFESDLGYVVVS